MSVPVHPGSRWLLAVLVFTVLIFMVGFVLFNRPPNVKVDVPVVTAELKEME